MNSVETMSTYSNRRRRNTRTEPSHRIDLMYYDRSQGTLNLSLMLRGSCVLHIKQEVRHHSKPRRGFQCCSKARRATEGDATSQHTWIPAHAHGRFRPVGMVSPKRSRVLAILWRLPVPSRRIAPRFCVTPSVYLGVYLGTTSNHAVSSSAVAGIKKPVQCMFLILKRSPLELLNSPYAFVLYHTATPLR